ncbi:MAG: hypothetical protein WDO12_05730 [Pseudomonadota bacterium]
MKIRNLVLALAAALVALPALAAAAAGIDGKWNATVDSPMGAVSLVMQFKSEGEKFSGTITTDMAGQALPPAPISEGLVKGDDITFKLSFAMAPDQPAIIISYKGKLKGDELTLTSIIDMGQGPQETQLVAHRAK